MDVVGPDRGLALAWLHSQMVGDVDAANDEDPVIQLDLPDGLGGQPPLASRDLARFQRASQRPGRSAGRRRDEVVEGGRVGLVDLGVHPIVLGYLGVDPEEHRGRLDWKVGPAQGALDPLDADPRPVGDLISHSSLPHLIPLLQLGYQRPSAPPRPEPSGLSSRLS